MSYMNPGLWQTGWTSSTAHLVTGMARAHGNARYAKVTSVCGQSFCPGRGVELNALPDGITACTKCQQPAKPKAAKRPSTPCTQCGDPNLSTKSPLCGFCREMARP